MELPGKTTRGRLKRLIMDAVSEEDMAVVEVTKEDAEDRIKRRWKIRCTWRPITGEAERRFC